MVSLTYQDIQNRIEHNHLPEQNRIFGSESEMVFRRGSFVGSSIQLHDRLPRTMELARELVQEAIEQGQSFHNGTIILANELGESKGRFTRSWYAPQGGLWGCLVHVGSLLDKGRGFIPLAVGVACCQTAREFGLKQAELRWVNDVLVKGEKLAGFLIESFADKRFGERYDVIGFGINVNNCSFPEELQGLATSIARVLGEEIDLNDFARSFFARLSWNLGLIYHEDEALLQNGCYSGPENLHHVLAAWKELSRTEGQRVRYGFDVMENPQYEATVLKVLDDGGLLMQFDDGTTTVENSGEVRYL